MAYKHVSRDLFDEAKKSDLVRIRQATDIVPRVDMIPDSQAGKIQVFHAFKTIDYNTNII